MKITQFTKMALKIRREKRGMEAKGWRLHPEDLTLSNGGEWMNVITDVKISANGKRLWIKTGKE